ncbi:MAG: arginine--tRNA ligase [Endomicrobium sp.]|nr:arginine--tRNA ligase [Endomicrobium sp.]
MKQNIVNKLNKIIKKYLESYGLVDESKLSIKIPPKNIDADFATNIAMLIAKKNGEDYIIVAKKISNDIIKKNPNFIEKAEVLPPGFINLHIKKEIFYKEIFKILKEKNKYGKLYKKHNEKIIFEFVSANPTGPLHIGHGRGAVIGDSLSRILSYLGHNVTKEYYLNNVGNQILNLAESTKNCYKQLVINDKLNFSKNEYKGNYIVDIAKRLIEKYKNITEIDFQKETVKEILKMIKNDLKSLDVKFDNWFFETKLAINKDINGKTEVDKICEYLISKNYAYIKNGALWLASSKFGDDKDRVIRRSNGRYTYFASDIAYHKNKFERKFTKLINLWGADHHGYIKRIKACIQMLGFNQEALKIIIYQFVSVVRDGGVSVAMSTRTGEFITLKSILDEVGKDTCRFLFLLNTANSQLEFNVDLAKKQSIKNPVFYIQYVNARCNSIIKKCKNKKNITTNIKNINFNLLNTNEEKKLIKHLTEFCNILSLSEKTMSPHYLATYLVELADKYHTFYEKCQVLSDNLDLTSARLKLVESVIIIIQNGLKLLGISCPNKM